jgi:DNA-binding LytR/AlgR family response regulator
MKILIAEDEMLISEMLKEILIELGHEVVGQTLNFQESIELLDKNPKIELVLCDINFGEEKTGIDLAKELQNKYQLPFIYLTSYSDKDTVVNAAKTNPLAYLLKPFNIRDIKTTLILVEEKLKKEDQFIVFKDGYNQVKLYASNIVFVESDNNYITIQTVDRKFTIRNSLENFINKLSCHHLMRVHRSYAVNLKKVDSISSLFLFIGGQKIPLSRKYKEDISSKYSLLSL